jgi:hypothetical protein
MRCERERPACGKSATPPAAALCAKYRARSGAPGTPAPAAERYALARPAVDQPGGDPAPPIGCRHASTAARTNAAGRRGAALEAPASARAPASRSEGPHGPSLRETAGSPRGDRGGEPAGQGHAARPAPLRCAPLERLHGRRGYTPPRAGFRSAAPTVPASALLEHPRAKLRCAARRVPLLALRLAVCVPLLRRCTASASRPARFTRRLRRA